MQIGGSRRRRDGTLQNGGRTVGVAHLTQDRAHDIERVGMVGVALEHLLRERPRLIEGTGAEFLACLREQPIGRRIQLAGISMPARPVIAYRLHPNTLQPPALPAER